MKSKYALFAVLAVVLTSIGYTQKSTSAKPERIQLEMKAPSTKAETVAKLVTGLGKVDTRWGTTFLIELKKGIDADTAIAKLQHAPGVRSVHEDDDHSKATKEEHGNERYGILDARKFWFAQRAFPKGYIDTSAYIKAAKYRDNVMTPANVVDGTSSRSVQQPTTVNSWQFLGPKNMGGASGTTPWSGRINGIAYAPGSSSTFYIASASGGVWKTTDSGVNWTPLSDTWPFMYTSCVKVNPSNANIVYVGTGDFDGDYTINGFSFGCGVMKSTDAGATWTSLNSATFGPYSVSDIIIDPETPTTITVSLGRGHADSGFAGAGYIYRSIDSGATWTKVLNVNKSWSKLSMSAISAGIRYYYAISQDGTVYKSADRGATWALVTTPLPPNGGSIDRICAHPTNQQVVYLLDSDNARVYKSSNAGGTWTDVTGNLGNNFGQAWYDAYLGVSSVSGNDWVVVGEIDVSLSTAGGNTWADVGQVYGPGTPQLHPDQHCIAFDPNDATSGVIGCDGGVYHFHYDTNTSSFTGASLNANLYVTELYNAAIHPSNANIVLSGAQDNATQYSRNGVLSTWELEIGGDGGYCGINQSNTQLQYGSYVFGSLYQTTDEWNTTLNHIQNQQPAYTGTGFIAPFALDPNNQSLLYSTTAYGLNRFNSSTSSWSNFLGGTSLCSAGPFNYLLAIAIAPSNSNTIYTGASDGQVWMSTNQGASWTRIDGGTPALPIASVTSIAVDPTNPNDVLVGFSGTGTGHIYRCTNPTAGASRVWTNVTSSLPDIPLNAIARDPAVAGSWYVGTDAGVFKTVDSGTTWTNATNPYGLPNVQVNTLKIRASDRRMYAATFGRGVWVMQLPYPSVVKNISVAPTQITSGNTGTGTVNLWQADGVSNTVVNLSSNNAAATVPATATVLMGQTSGNFTVNTSNSTYSSITATITESLGGDPNHTFNVKVAPNNRASFVSQTTPSSMIAGQSYPVSIVFTNAGTTTWDFATHQYELGSVNPYNNNTWGMNRIPLQTASVAPSANGTFTATVIAPMTAGTYNFQWQPYEGSDGTFFGQTSTNVVVTVTKNADAARYISRTGATTVSCGQDFYVQNTMMNVGTNTWTNAGGYHEISVAPYANTTWTTKYLYLPANSNIAPGAQVTFTGLCTAPITPGTYTMQWSVDHNGVTFGDRPPLLNITVNLGADDAQYISTTSFPKSIGPSGTFGATFTMMNLGTATWDSNYSLVSTGNNNFGVASIPVTGTVLQNANGTFTQTFTAPASPGTYTFQYRMQHTTTKFGQASPLVSIVVSADAAQYISRTGPTTVNAGQDFYVQNLFKDTGTTSWSTATSYSMMTVNPNNDSKWTATRGYLPSGTIAPGSTGTFTALCTAPITAGTYTMQWQMNKAGAPFGEKSPLLSITVTLGADDAQYVTQSGIPTTIVHSTTFTPSITMKNLGTATWDGTYSLVSIGSNNFGVPSIPAVSTAQNSNDVFSTTFTAPATPGTYTFQMRMQHGSTKFGQVTVKVTITVT